MERREEERERRIEEESIGKFLEVIPRDLIHDILLRLPAKSVARFRCVSKLWSTITTRPSFISSFATQSSTRRRSLLFYVRKEDNRRFIISLPQHDHHSDSSYSHVDCYQIPPKLDHVFHKPMSESVHGLMCFEDLFNNIVVCNPSIRQHVILPEPKPGLKLWYLHSCLGYDPVEDKYKVLCIPSRKYKDPLVFTLGPQESWRVIQNIPHHFPRFTNGRIGVCIKGHVYYEAEIRSRVDDETFQYEGIVMSFDVRYEKFNTIKKPADSTLRRFMFNYKGKLAWGCSNFSNIRFWVLDDEEKQEWSLKNFPLPFPSVPLYDPILEVHMSPLMGITHDTGEFVYIAHGFEEVFVLYYDPKRNRIRRISCVWTEDEELWEDSDLKHTTSGDSHCYSDHIETLMSLDNVPCCVPPIYSKFDSS